MSSTNGDRARHKRSWWRNWTTLAVLAFIGVLILVRWGAGYRATKRLQVEIGRYRAASQPVYLSDFDPPAVADKDNAALVLKQATEALDALSKGQKDLVRSLLGDPSTLGQHREDAKAIVEGAKEAVLLVRKARSLPGTDWGFRLTNHFMGGEDPNSGPIRELGRVLAVEAMYCHAEGDEAEAVELLRDLLVLSKHTDRHPSVIFHLVATAIAGLSCQSVETVSARLEVARSGPTSRTASRPAVRSQVQDLIQELLDQEAFQANLIRALYGERAIQLDTCQQFKRGLVPDPGGTGRRTAPRSSPWGRLVGFAFESILDSEALRLLRHTTAQAEAALEPTWPGFKRRAPGRLSSGQGLGAALRMLSDLLQSDFERGIQLHYRCLVHRRMAATALAIRMHELDRGRRPSKLDDLVPKYLPYVPDDPFSASGGKIGYRPNGKPPVLYSVNLDGVDEGGAFGLRPTGDVDWEVKDLPFFLNGDRPRGNPTTTASQPTTTSSRPVK